MMVMMLMLVSVLMAVLVILSTGGGLHGRDVSLALSAVLNEREKTNQNRIDKWKVESSKSVGLCVERVWR